MLTFELNVREVDPAALAFVTRFSKLTEVPYHMIDLVLWMSGAKSIFDRALCEA
jgi:hypothetical protein